MLGKIEKVKCALIMGLTLPAIIWEGFVRPTTLRSLPSSRNTQPRTVHIDADYKGKVGNLHSSAFPYLSFPTTALHGILLPLLPYHLPLPSYPFFDAVPNSPSQAQILTW